MSQRAWVEQVMGLPVSIHLRGPGTREADVEAVVAAPEAIASAVLLVGSAALAIPFAGRLYAGAILRIGARVKLRDAWRAAR